MLDCHYPSLKGFKMDLPDNFDVEDIKTEKVFEDTRRTDYMQLKITPKLNYIFTQFLRQLQIDNKSKYLTELIKVDIRKAIEADLVVIE